MESDRELVAKCERRVGGVLGDGWRLERLIGVGGMAAVYAARDSAGQRAAIKLLHKAYAQSPNIRARFLREAYIANKIDHPGVVRVLGDGVSELDEPFLVMELLLGMSVDQLLSKQGGRVGIRQSLHITEGVLETLEKAHALGVVHRDLKPDNLFIIAGGPVKVLDFGIARLLEKQDSGHTRTGVIMGTPAFMAPEQALGRWREVDARSDLWSVGAILFLLISGRAVHGFGAGNDLLIRTATQSAPSLGRIISAPLPLVRLVDRALAYDPKRRFPDAAGMRAEVLSVLSELGDSDISARDTAQSLSPFEQPTLAPNEVMVPPPSTEPMSPRTMAARIEAESIVDERFALSVAKAYREARARGNEKEVTEPIRNGLRQLATRQPESALALLLTLCKATTERLGDDARATTDFATAILSTRTLRILIENANKPGADVAATIRALKPLLRVLGDSHAGVALEQLSELPEGALSELLIEYVARNGKGYEQEMGELLTRAEPTLGVALVKILAKVGTPAAGSALARALESPHQAVRIEARSELAE